MLAEICKGMVDDLSPSIHTLTIGRNLGNHLINLLTKIYDIAFQWESKYMLFACREVRIGENCTRGLYYWGHSFSYTDRRSRQMTYLFFPTNKIFMNILLQPTQFMLCTCVDVARDQMQNQN